MSLTLRVTYAATDGSMPESVELEWTDVQPTAAAVLPLLERLMSAPAEYRAGLFPLRTAPASDPAEPRCKRAVCGHRRSDHGLADADAALGDRGSGRCLVCDNPDMCRAFVGTASPSDYPLPHGAKRGEILAPGMDGAVRNVGAFNIGTKFDMAGPAAEDLKAGRVGMVNGSWYQKETA